MATFKDIAAAAGVSYGTVSNVLNGRGNVSSDKIQRVHQAAERLGYTINQGAQLLRKGNTDTLAIVLPNISERKYTDCYISFQNYAESRGYKTALYLHNGDRQREMDLISEIKSTKAAGVATVSCLDSKIDPYQQVGFSPNEVQLVEQRPYAKYDYIGFDYDKIGREMGRRAQMYQNVILLTESMDTYVAQQFTKGFMSEARKTAECQVQHYEKESSIRSASLSLDIFSSSPAAEVVFSTSLNYAGMLRSIQAGFFENHKLDIYTVSPLFTLPENDFRKYELNYRLLGKISAQRLIQRITAGAKDAPTVYLLPENGFRQWNPGPVPSSGSLLMMTLDSPTALIVKNMARMYTRFTGIPVKVAIFPYDGVHEMLTKLDASTQFDIIRLDATWLSWFAPKIFEPLNHLDPHVNELEKCFIPDLLRIYGGPQDAVYALPETPSAQMLFYRKDLFSDVAVRRLYQENTHEVLRPPVTFEEYNRIAHFFTKRYNPNSPVKYGHTLTLGNTGTAATEFLTRYFALTKDLFDDNDRILLNSEAGIQALRELAESSRYANLSFSNWWRDTAKMFATGEVAMTILYSNYASEMTGKLSRIRGDIGYSMVPGANPLLGGGSIGVCKYSQQKELAYHFIIWLCGEEVSSAMTLLGSVSPCRGTYLNYHVIDTYPWLSITEDCFRQSVTHRLPHNAAVPFDERRFLGILGIQVINVINGYCSPEEALKEAEEIYNTTMNPLS